MNIENKFNIGDKVFICGNLNHLRQYITIEPLVTYGELRAPFRDILNGNIKENVKVHIVEALKIKETEIRDINVYITGTDKPTINYEVDYNVYPYELEENRIYRTKEEAAAVVEAEIQKLFDEIHQLFAEKMNNAKKIVWQLFDENNFN